MIWLKRLAIFLAVSLAAIFVLDKLFPPPIERLQASGAFDGQYQPH